MKRQVLKAATLALVALAVASCGKNGSSSEFFGEVPQLLKEKHDNEEALKEKAKSCEDTDCFIKLTKENREQEDAFKASMEQQGQKLQGKEIPIEINGIPFKISKPLVITKVTKKGEIKAECEFELTIDTTFATNMDYLDFGYSVCFVDKQGNVMKDRSFYPRDVTQSALKDIKIAAGSKYPYTLTVNFKDEIEKWEAFDKIVVKEKIRK